METATQPIKRKGYLLRFKAEKLRNGVDVFEDRYTPVILYWAEKKIKKDSLSVYRSKIQLFEQDVDNAIKDLVTLRLEFELNNA